MNSQVDSNRVLRLLSVDLQAYDTHFGVSVDPFVASDQSLILRDDINEVHIGIGEAGDSANIELSTGVPFYTDQDYRVHIFLKANAGKNNERALNNILLGVKDTVIKWLKELNYDRDIYTLTEGQLETASYTGARGEAIHTDSYMSLDIGFTSRRKL